MARKRVADVLVDTLVAADVKRVYGLVGDSLNGVTDSIRPRQDLQWVPVRHEETAAFECLAITSLADVPATAYQRRDCGPVGLRHLHEPCDDNGRGRSHCGANRVPDRRKVFLVPSPEFHASMIFPEQALWQDRQTFPSPRFLLKKFYQRLSCLLWS